MTGPVPGPCVPDPDLSVLTARSDPGIMDKRYDATVNGTCHNGHALNGLGRCWTLNGFATLKAAIM